MDMSGVATVVCITVGPFSPLASGKLFFEEVVDAIGRVIETETEHRAKKVRTRMNKYVTKYRK